MAAAQYVLLAALVIATKRRAERSAWLLAGILIITAFVAVDTLLIWSDSTRQLALDWMPGVLFIGSLGYWLTGPLLMLYIKSVLYQGFRLKPIDALHILPLVFALLLLSIYYFGLGADAQRALMLDQQFMWTPLMSTLMSGQHLSIIAYCSFCIFLLARYRSELRERYANLEDGERWWLLWIVLGFIAISLWSLLLHWTGNAIGQTLGNSLGIAKNYFTYLFVNSLVFISIRNTQLFDAIKPNNSDTKDYSEVKTEHVNRIERYMETEEPYLQADISLEKLARQLSIPERALSRALNRHFEKNFFEFINAYRIEKAKFLLRDAESKEKSILDILLESGFTSKSSFNTIFKKTTGLTPSSYRKATKSN